MGLPTFRCCYATQYPVQLSGFVMQLSILSNFQVLLCNSVSCPTFRCCYATQYPVQLSGVVMQLGILSNFQVLLCNSVSCPTFRCCYATRYPVQLSGVVMQLSILSTTCYTTFKLSCTPCHFLSSLLIILPSHCSIKLPDILCGFLH